MLVLRPAMKGKVTLRRRAGDGFVIGGAETGGFDVYHHGAVAVGGGDGNFFKVEVVEIV